MLTRQAKRELLELEKKTRDAMAKNVSQEEMMSLIERLKGIKLAIKEIDRLESECER